VVWVSTAAAALAFGALHLPATAVLVELTPLTVARALLLNAPLGIVFGWLAWRRGLEVAMASHLIADILIITSQHLMS
jgi:membrane protease YdiL (CAAX protease family)